MTTVEQRANYTSPSDALVLEDELRARRPRRCLPPRDADELDVDDVCDDVDERDDDERDDDERE